MWANLLGRGGGSRTRQLFGVFHAELAVDQPYRAVMELPRPHQDAMDKPATVPVIFRTRFGERFGNAWIASDAAAFAVPWLRFGEFALA